MKTTGCDCKGCTGERMESVYIFVVALALAVGLVAVMALMGGVR